jgi:hypothetical protein
MINSPIRLGVVICSILALSGTAYAADSLGVGNASCAVFAKEYQKRPTMTEAIYHSWLHGFLTGINISFGASNFQTFDLGKKSQDERNAFMRDYCAKNPLATYLSGAMSFIETLPRRPKGE